MSFSATAARLRDALAIYDLMDDLGTALNAGGDLTMLGGGNPARIPPVIDACADALDRLGGSAGIARRLADYDPPQGPPAAREAVADYLRARYGWRIDAAHVGFVPGSQATFGYLFSIFAGRREDGTTGEVWLPLAPEYIGYFGAGAHEVPIRAFAPTVTDTGPGRFKYGIDWARLQPDARCALMAVSVPTNPSGNLLTQVELDRLTYLCRAATVPLVIDLAYGDPFPGIVGRHVTPPFGDGIVLALSLSKLGLPGLRTGIVVAAPEVIDLVARFNAATVLAGPGLGPALVTALIESGQIDPLCREHIAPFYRDRRQRALEIAEQALAGTGARIHEPEGAFFLWLELPPLVGGTTALYRRLKARGVLVLPGKAFFGNAPVAEREKDRCLRVSCAQPDAVLERGFAAIAEEAARA